MLINSTEFFFPRNTPPELISILQDENHIAIFIDNLDYEDLIVFISKKQNKHLKLLFSEFENIFKKDNKKQFMSIGKIFKDKVFEGPADSIEVVEREFYDKLPDKVQINEIYFSIQKYRVYVCFQKPNYVFKNLKDGLNYLFDLKSGALNPTKLSATITATWDKKSTQDIRFSYKQLKDNPIAPVMHYVKNNTLFITTISNLNSSLSEYSMNIYNCPNETLRKTISEQIHSTKFKYVSGQTKDFIVFPSGNKIKYKYVSELNNIDYCCEVSEICDKLNVLRVMGTIYEIKSGPIDGYDPISGTLYVCFET